MSERFPFSLEDITGWIVKRKDGTILKYSLVSAAALVASEKKSTTSYSSYYSMKEWCKHEPHPATQPPVFTAKNIGLWIADAPGARVVAKDFDVCIDGGNVLNIPGEHDLPNIYGDPKLRNALSRHVVSPASGVTSDGPRIIKLRWFDRAAPPVYASFWPALLEELLKLQAKLHAEPLRVLTICQGGHGRSGTALVSLMMCLTDYTPLDALTHIRALHCARAIESKEQHVYLNSLAKLLGREENALEAESVPSFKDRFLASTSEWAAPYKERLQSGGGATITTRDEAFI